MKIFISLIQMLDEHDTSIQCDSPINLYGDVTHPLVRTHPVTGKKALWFTDSEMNHVIGMPPEDSHATGSNRSNDSTRMHLYASLGGQ